MKNKISTTIITLNEEGNIARCIESVKSFSDEIILIDCGSTDNTITIANKLSCSIYINKFKNYAAQKNFAISKTSSDWIFSIDADETASEGLQKEILQSLSAGKVGVELAEFDAFSIPRKNYILGKFIKHTRWQPELDRHIWLFRKSKAKWVGDVHEEIEVNGSVGKIKHAKNHYQDKTITEFLNKLNKYSEIEANLKFKNNVRFSIIKAIFQVKYNFFVRYVYRLGFLDGWRGFVLSYLMAIYHFEVWIKLWHLNQKTN